MSTDETEFLRSVSIRASLEKLAATEKENEELRAKLAAAEDVSAQLAAVQGENAKLNDDLDAKIQARAEENDLRSDVIDCLVDQIDFRADLLISVLRGTATDDVPIGGDGYVLMRLISKHSLAETGDELKRNWVSPTGAAECRCRFCLNAARFLQRTYKHPAKDCDCGQPFCSLASRFPKP